jgi:hypothetical protein
VLELDHVFCLVADPGRAVRRLEDAGWAAETRVNPLRLDRRAEWNVTGASPFGLGFRGRLDAADRDDYSLYDAVGPRIWIHRDNERFPERPLVFVLEIERRTAAAANATRRSPPHYIR